jgi:hypothetical protein
MVLIIGWGGNLDVAFGVVAEVRTVLFKRFRCNP